MSLEEIAKGVVVVVLGTLAVQFLTANIPAIRALTAPRV